MKVVRIVQNRAPSELSYLLDDAMDVAEFIDAWREQNPDRFITAQSMPIIDMRDGWSEIPVVYPPVA